MRITYPQTYQHEDKSITHLFLMIFCHRLEASFSVGPRTGWQPRHLLAETADGTLLGAAPCYVKSHSRGEYVFDAGWAEAFEHAGGDYYPKLQVAVPFTPVTGPRLLARPGPLAEAVRGALADALVEITTSNELSSAHVTFLTEPEWRAAGRARLSCNATTSNSTGRMPATRRSTISSPPCRRASARPSAASARRRWSPASRWFGSPAPI